MSCNPILNPPVDYSRIGQAEAEAAQANEPVVLDVTVSEDKTTAETVHEAATEDADAKPGRAQGRR